MELSAHSDPAPNGAEPLAARRLFQTRDLDQARAIVGQKFCDHRLEIHAHAARFDAAHHRAEGQATSLNFIRYGADVAIEPGELGSFYLIQIPLAGQARIDNGSGPVQSGAGLGSVLNPHRETRMQWKAGCAQLLMQIDARALGDQAERLLGAPLAAPVSFDTAVDEQAPATARWIRKLRTCFRLAEQQALFCRGNIHTQALAEEDLITGFLLAQPSDISDRLTRAAQSSRPVTNTNVKKALRFIEAHLHEPITLGDMAAAAGVSARCLQQGFRSSFDQTPMQVLRQRRLIHARTLLQREDPGTQIRDICLRAGFTHFGRFSVAYRAAFGESPSQTQRRGA